jgi:hypothetical protein
VEIAFQRSGGVAGLTMGCEVDTEKLPPAEARELEELVEKLEASGAGSGGPAQPDRFQYELTVTRGGKARSFQLAEQALTPEGRELVKRLTERARKG